MGMQSPQRGRLAALFAVLLTLFFFSCICVADQDENILSGASSGNDSQESLGTEDSEYDSEYLDVAKEVQGQNSGEVSGLENHANQSLNDSYTEESESSVSLNDTAILPLPPEREENKSAGVQNDLNALNEMPNADSSISRILDEEGEPTVDRESTQAADSMQSDSRKEQHGIADTVDSVIGEQHVTGQQYLQDADHNEESDFIADSESDSSFEETTTNTEDNINDEESKQDSTENKSTRSHPDDKVDSSSSSTKNDSITEEKLRISQERDLDYLDFDDETPNDTANGMPSRSEEQPEGENKSGTGNDGMDDSMDQFTSEANKTETFHTQDDADFVSDAGPMEQKTEEQPDEETLASFFEKLKNKNQDTHDAFHDKLPKKETSKVSTSEHQPADSTSLEEEASNYKYYSTTWGVSSSTKRYANLEVLGMIFDQQLVDDAKDQHRKIFEPVELVIPSLYSKIMDGEATANVDLNATNLKAPLEDLEGIPRSANTEFVEGLDDLDKFFQSVEPPDELDVGAAGTSIQEALMGQTSKIIVKKLHQCRHRFLVSLKTGGRYMVTTFIAIKRRTADFLNDQDWKLPEINKEKFEKFGKLTVARGRNGVHYLKDLLQSVFQSDDEDEFEDYANDLESRLKDLTGSYGSS